MFVPPDICPPGQLEIGGQMSRGTLVLGGHLSGGTVVLGGQLSWGNTCPGGPLVQGDNCPGGQMSGGQMSGGRLSGGQMSHHHNFLCCFFCFSSQLSWIKFVSIVEDILSKSHPYIIKINFTFHSFEFNCRKNLYFKSFFILNCRDFDFWPELPPFFFLLCPLLRTF